MSGMIELENITKIYQMGEVEVPALRGITLSVEEGEMVALIGASGSGKSTLMNIIGFLDQPTEGRYLLEDVDVSELNDNKLAEMRNRKVGFVFQTYNLLPRTSALANVELPLIYAGSRQKSKLAMEALDEQGSAAYNLSTGEGHSVREVIEAVKAVSGRDFAVREEPRRPGDAPILVGSHERIQHALGWQPQMAGDEGMALTVKWYQDNEWWWRKIKSGEFLEYYKRQYEQR